MSADTYTVGDEHRGACFVCSGNHSQSQLNGRDRRRFLSQAASASLASVGITSGLLSASAPALADKHKAVKVAADLGDEFVVEAGWALVVNAGELELLADASVLVRSGVIHEIRSKPIPGNMPRIREPGHLLVPGFISGHTHVCSATPTRGIIEGPRSYIRPLELVEKLSNDELDALTAFNLAELLRSGCTTQVEMSLSLRQAESYVRVASEWGVRGYPGSMIPDISRLAAVWFRSTDQVLWDSESETLREIAANLEFGKKHMGSGNGRILPMMAPHAADTQTEATMKAIADASRELGTGLHIHLSQSSGETQTIRRLWGKTPTQWLQEFGFFEAPVFGAHMSGLDWDVDPAILNRYGVVYSHCPSGGGAGGGTQPYPEALGAGMRVNIGIDTHSNDYVEDLKLAVLLGQARFELLHSKSRVPIKNPTIWSAIKGATLIAAEGLRRQDLGRIAPGARADLVSIDVSGLLVGSGSRPPEPLNNLLYANGKMVRHVMTDGRLQILDGKLTVDDESKVLLNGGQVVDKIWTQLAEEGWFTPTPR